MKQLFHRLINRGDKLTSTYLTIVIISVGTFLIGFTTTSIFARTVAMQNKTDYEQELTQQVQSVKLQVSERVSAYNELLYAAAAQFSAKPDMNQDDWRNFYKTMQIQRQFRSISGVGYAERVQSDAISAFQEDRQADGMSDFTVNSIAPGDEHAIIKYVEPSENVHYEWFGYDMASDPTRRDAMHAARDSGEAYMSRPLRLLPDAKSGQSLGSVLILPVYHTKMPPSTVEERRAQLMGYAVVAFRPGDIMSRIVGSTPRLNDNVNVSLVSISSDTGQTLYAANYARAASRNLTTASRDISVFGQTWRVSLSGQDQAINQFYGPLGLFFFGAGMSALLGLIVYFALMNRLSRVQEVYEEDVENTKSELLALASHQLRTPATGVKQYLGILREGIMGALTPAQQEVVEKAFQTNERQLHVINDLLYVSKVETGQLMIDPVRTDVTKITKEVIANLKSRADEKSIALTFTSSKKPVIITADDRYVGMIIENLISNAIKYSYPSSTVRITLRLAAETMTLKVADQGVGIAPKDIKRAFSKFNRIDNPLSRQEGGSGLGLFLANQLAKGHGGTIGVEPRRTRGTTFVLTMPSVAMIDHDIVNLAVQHKRGKRITGQAEAE